MEFQAKWIGASQPTKDVCPVFRKVWKQEKAVRRAELYLTALGVYEAQLNQEKVGSGVLAPGWTVYEKRLQYQVYDITEQLRSENELRILVGKGWFSSPMPGWLDSEDKKKRMSQPNGIFAEIHLIAEDGTEEILATDESWEWCESQIRFSEIYDGETCDATVCEENWSAAAEFEWSTKILIPQEGEEIKEQERVAASRIFRTPKGELVVDFGQEVTGYVEFSVDAKEGDLVRILHGEVLDRDGNFYNDNYRSAKAELNYICREGKQTWHPQLTFFGFRYLKLAEFPGEPKAEQFTAIVVYSDIRQTGKIQCGNAELNQLFSNILWGQRGNFLDVPTDCPQRDERLGWTGDAQVFVKAASYNYDVERFFQKWLHDIAADQRADGSVGQVIPDYLPEGAPSSGWGDAAVICPWQIYETYGNDQVLRDQFQSMKKWVDYITAATEEPYLWIGGEHFGDWLGLDAPSGSYKGSTRESFIASAFYAYSTSLLIQAGHVIGEDVSAYEALYEKIVETFRKTFPEYQTQTEYVLALQFHLAENPQQAADELAQKIREVGTKIQTGFIGTPYILHVLSAYGHTGLAYDLLLRRAYPSWLYSVGAGATTIWEHWDGIMENGDFWSRDMNSFNHYAYGSVADWIYEKAAGIRPQQAGFASAVIAPQPDERLGWLDVSLETRNGQIHSAWKYTPQGIRYEISTAVPACIIIEGKEYQAKPGSYVFWGK